MNRDPKQLLAKAMAALNAGEFEDARQGLQTLNSLAPENADVLSYLGFAEANLGLPEGLARTSKAVELSPQNPQILMNHAFALDKAGEAEKAIEVLEVANRAAPDQAPILNHLTRLLVEQGNFQKARPLTGKLVTLAPKEPAFAQRHLGVLIALGDGEAGKVFVNSIEAHFSGIRLFQEMKARAARAAKDWPEAFKYYKTLSETDPENLVYKRGLAHSLLGLEDFGSVIPILKEIRKKEPENEQVIYSMAFALFHDNRHEECLPFIEIILGKEPDHVDALLLKGQSLVFFGEFDKAQAIFKRVLELFPDHPMAVMQLTKVRRPKTRDESFTRLEKMEKKARDQYDYKALMNFTLGEMYERIGDYDTAFERFKKGNDLAKAAYKKRGYGYSREATEKEFSQIRSLYSKENLKALRGAGEETNLPIFIAAMPRSGTTLLEQVISSHPEVFGAGELPLGNAAAAKLLEDLPEKTPEELCQKLKHEAKKYARLYLDYLPKPEPGKTRISDKMPGNFRHLGFLQTVLPGASYIVIRRNPLDVCLSMFKGFFNKGFPYAVDLGDLGFYYRQFHELMDHWKNTLELPVLEVQYEDFVADPDAGGRRVFDHLGLDWDPAYLDFYKRKNKVITQSTLQVREPVHKKAVNKWRRYKKHLDPLLKGLGPDIVKTLEM